MQELNLSDDRVILKRNKLSKNTYEVLKRIMDIICSMIGLIILAPIMIVVAMLIKIESKGPIIFSQERVGINTKRFKMYKFRSMIINAEEMKENLAKQNERKGPMFKIKNDPRVTAIGRFIRRTSIDELPQLVNILKGEMSIVGPRPSLPNEVIKFEPWMFERLKVKPGLTCYWQTQGRDNIEFEDWMRLDVKYVKDRSLILDIKLIFKTFFVFLGDKNAS